MYSSLFKKCSLQNSVAWWKLTPHSSGPRPKTWLLRMRKTVRMSQDGPCPGDFMLQNVNCPHVKLGQEFPGVAFRGHLRSLPKLMEITSSSHASKSLWSCWYCSLADQRSQAHFYCSIYCILCCSLFCVVKAHLWSLLRKQSSDLNFTCETGNRIQKERK